MRRPSNGSLIVAVSALMPVILWCLFGWRELNLNILGRWCGLVGLALLSINIILSARLKFFDVLFRGLDKMYRVHHTIGCLTLITLLLHANLLLIAYASLSIQTSYSILTSMDPPFIAGRIGLLLLTSAMVVVLYIKVSYKKFLLAQRIMGAVIFVGGYHALFAPGSDIRRITALFIYMVMLGGLAISVYIYRSLFHKSFERPHTHTITSLVVRGNITSVTLKPIKHALRHYAGQYAFLTFKSTYVAPESHPFTISSGSASKELEFNIKQLGDFTSTLPQLQIGDTVEVDGPYGQFSYTKIGGAHQTWIAGGIGITPFLSMARSLPRSLKVDLYYSVVKKSDAVFLPELKTIAKKHKNFRVFPVYTDTGGILTIETIQRQNGLGDNILLCGPPPMMKSLKNQLLQAGKNNSNIYYEGFSLS